MQMYVQRSIVLSSFFATKKIQIRTLRWYVIVTQYFEYISLYHLCYIILCLKCNLYFISCVCVC